MSLPETNPTSPNERDIRLDAEVRMVRVMEEMIRLQLPYDYLTYVIDPRQFSTSAEDVPVGLGIAHKGAIARVTSIDELNQCVVITPTISEEGRLGVTVISSPQQAVPVELGACIDKLVTGMESLQKAIEMFASPSKH